MVLPVRVILIVGGAVVTAGGGVWTGAVGAVQIRRAQKQIDSQTAVYSQRYTLHLEGVEQTNRQFEALGVAQERALNEVIYRMRDYLQRHERLVKASDHLILEGLDGANRPILGLTELPQDAVAWVRGIVGSASAGLATSGAVKAAVSRFGSATTGRALGSLNGAVGQRATQAWWGGGSIATGGGGIALGKYVQYAPLAAPAILAAGVALKIEGSKARSAAEEHRVRLAIEKANLDGRDEMLAAVRRRTTEVEGVLNALIDQAVASIDALEVVTSESGIPPEPFQKAIILVTSVRDLATAPIADDEGRLDHETGELFMRYRGTERKASDG
jgi:hypothetical protein